MFARRSQVELSLEDDTVGPESGPWNINIAPESSNDVMILIYYCIDY